MQHRFLFTELFLNYSRSSCVCVRDSVHVAPDGAENTHGNTHKRHLLSAEIVANFFDRGFPTGTVSNKGNGAPRCEGA